MSCIVSPASRGRGADGEAVGHDDLVTTARTYTHVIADEAEVDYAQALA
jgi:hypothetical protein